MNEKIKSFISAIIYVHNAEATLAEFLEKIIYVLQENFEYSEIICVNDYSWDDSVDIIRSMREAINNTCISIVNMSYFHGKELSMKAGIDLSVGDFVFEFDNTVADFDPDLIMELYHRAMEGFDIVSASKKSKLPFTSKMFYYLLNRFGNAQQEILHESFRILSRRVINRINSNTRTMFYRKILYANCGLKTDHIYYDALDSNVYKIHNVESKYRWDLAVDSLILFTRIGFAFSLFMTGLMMFMMIFVLMYSVVYKIMANPVPGWASTISFLSVCFFGLFGILTIIIKYLQLLVDLAIKRNSYSFENIIKC